MPTKVIDQIKELIVSRFKGEVNFSDPVTVKPTPHQPIVYIHAAAADNVGGVWLMCDAGHWFPVEDGDQNVLPVVQSVFQRLQILKNGIAN
jgi:hypothetical protein